MRRKVVWTSFYCPKVKTSMAFVRKSPRQVLQTSSRQRSDASILEQSLERRAKVAPKMASRSWGSIIYAAAFGALGAQRVHPDTLQFHRSNRSHQQLGNGSASRLNARPPARTRCLPPCFGAHSRLAGHRSTMEGRKLVPEVEQLKHLPGVVVPSPIVVVVAILTRH